MTLNRRSKNIRAGGIDREIQDSAGTYRKHREKSISEAMESITSCLQDLFKCYRETDGRLRNFLSLYSTAGIIWLGIHLENLRVAYFYGGGGVRRESGGSCSLFERSTGKI
ncbi:hypothetical membrane protein [Syntrophus aciditrophicus SB]|uniref:Hypothetical membrane protein n=1 Tax=Syntrophus aciditrophicus (strain SB) TaxID=56780 RepID=Q2LUN0_SYNAS|nr:hypothetical membrane protein [Syntrophus aciditrophicus SB]